MAPGKSCKAALLRREVWVHDQPQQMTIHHPQRGQPRSAALHPKVFLRMLARANLALPLVAWNNDRTEPTSMMTCKSYKSGSPGPGPDMGKMSLHQFLAPNRDWQCLACSWNSWLSHPRQFRVGSQAIHETLPTLPRLHLLAAGISGIFTWDAADGTNPPPVHMSSHRNHFIPGDFFSLISIT